MAAWNFPKLNGLNSSTQSFHEDGLPFVRPSFRIFSRMKHKVRKTLVLTVAAICAVSAAAARDITVTVPYGFTTLDPFDARDTLSQSAAKSFYEGLFGFDKNLKIVPVLATSYEAGADAKTYTVHLRPDVKFSDGEIFNAAAVKANFERVINPGNHLTRYSLFKNIASIEVVDDFTVRFHLHEPFSAFPNQLAHPSAGMLCPKILEKSKDFIAVHPCGTGPFVMESYNAADYLTVVKNPTYHDAGWPKLDRITFRPTPEDSTRAAMLSTGESQLTTVLAPETIPLLQRNSEIEIVSGPSIVHRQIYINNTKKPFTDKRVREALNYAVNKDALCKVVLKGYAVPSRGPAPEGLEYATQFGAWPYNPTKAKALLAEAGYPHGFQATLWSASNTSQSQKLLQFLQQQFAQVGVKVQVRALEAGQRVALVQAVDGPSHSKMDMVVWGWSASTGELDWMLRPLLATASWPPVLSNYGFYSNSVVDQAISEALQTTDKTKKQAIYNKALRAVWQDAPWVFLVVDKMLYAKNKHLKDFYVLPDGGLLFSHAYWQ